MDLLKFIVDMLIHHYKYTNHEAILWVIFGLASSPQGNQLRNLLSKGDISTMNTLQLSNSTSSSQEWSSQATQLDYPVSVALHAWMLVLGIKLTVVKPPNFFRRKMPGGRMVERSRDAVMEFLYWRGRV